MSDTTYSVFRYDNSQCLIEGVSHQEAVERAHRYYSKGGKSSLAFVAAGDEFQPRQRVEITKEPPRPTPAEGDQLEMLELTDQVQIVSADSETVRAVKFLLENGPKVGLDFSWSAVFKNILNGKRPTTDADRPVNAKPNWRSETGFVRDSMAQFIKEAQTGKLVDEAESLLSE